LHESVEKFAAVLRKATVEAEREFVEVGLKVSGHDGALVSAAQPSFKQGNDQMNMVEFLQRILAAAGEDVRMVIKSCGFEPIVNRKTIGHNDRAWLHTVPNKQLDARPVDRLDATKTDPAKLLLWIPLYRHKNRCFAFSPTPTGSFLLSAHIGLVNFHPPGQRFATRADHHTAKLL
jgi:hypothetical protein